MKILMEGEMTVFDVFIEGAVFEDFPAIPYSSSCLVFPSSCDDVCICLCSGIVVSAEGPGQNSSKKVIIDPWDDWADTL